MDRPRLLRHRCATCIFRPGNPHALGTGRLVRELTAIRQLLERIADGKSF